MKNTEYLIMLREAFDRAMSAFDFKTVKKVMRVIGWTWFTAGNPSKKDMIEMCESLFKTVVCGHTIGTTSSCSSGGFKVSVDPKDIVTVEFVLRKTYGQGVMEYE